jgi:hypothetical protein
MQKPAARVPIERAVLDIEGAPSDLPSGASRTWPDRLLPVQSGPARYAGASEESITPPPRQMSPSYSTAD